MQAPRLPALRVAICAWFTLASLAAAPLSRKEIAQGFRDGTVLAKVRDDTPPALAEAAEQAEGFRTARTFARAPRLRVLELDRAESVRSALDRLRATGRYDYVEPDHIMRKHASPNDPRYQNGDQWALRNTGQNGGKAGADISAEAAWNIQTSAASVIVAILDSGLAVNHEDLVPNLWRNPGESATNAQAFNLLDDDGNGYIDDINGINAIVVQRTVGSGVPADDDGHGTAVASVIGAATNNGTGMAGVAWNAQLMALKFLDTTGYGLVSDEVECLDYAIAKRAQIINCSFGGAVFSQTLFDALKRTRDAGIIIVASAGNDGENNDLSPHYPSGYLLDNIVSVANTTRLDELASSSDYGSGLVELGAPGTSILVADYQIPRAYKFVSGTSFSAPMVSGALALIKARFPGENYRETINRLLRSVDRVGPLVGKTATGGRLNLATALNSTSTAPFNDNFANRSILEGETITARGAAQFSSREAGEPPHAGFPGGEGSLWWTWTAPRAGTVTLSTADSAFDTTLGVYTGGAIAALVSVAANDDESATVKTSKLTFTAVAGTTYHIAVGGKASPLGLVVLRLNLLSANDAFASAQPVSGRSWAIAGDNRNATREDGEPRISGIAGGKSLWYRWEAPATRRYHLSAWSSDSEVNTILGLYTGPTLSTLGEVATATNFRQRTASVSDAALSFNAVAGTVYHIVVDGETAAAGKFVLSLTDSDWEFLASGGGFTTPAVDASGVLYTAETLGYLYAINPDGSQKWRFTMGGYLILGGPAIGPDGTIYIGDDANRLYAIDPANGTQKWRFTAADEIYSAPAIAADGTIYFRCEDGKLYALNPDGTKKWDAAVPAGPILSTASPIVAADGTVLCGSADKKLYAFAPDGTKKWEFTSSGEIWGAPAIAADGTLYLGTDGNKLHALRPDGTPLWATDLGDAAYTSPAIGTDGTIYLGCDDKKLYAISPTGAIRWTYLTGDKLELGAPVVAANGTVYVGSSDGFIHAVDRDGTRQRVFATGDIVGASPLLHNGMLYISSYDYRLYAVDVGQVPAGSPWPMERQNSFRTARPTTQTLAIGVAPKPQLAAVGEVARFSVAAVGTGNLTYQWRFNGTPIAGATTSALDVDPITLASAGQYSVVVSDTRGTAASSPVSLAVSGGVANSDARLVNLATRAVVGTGGDILIPGIFVSGTTPKQLLIRAAGPALTAFGVGGALARPQLVLLRGTTTIASNTGWGTAANPAALSAAFASVGAFPFAAGSADSALLATVDPGASYTAQVSGVSGTTGVALVEVYEIGAGAARLANLSCRARVGTGGDVLIPGITISGTTPRQLLIRAAGPVLSAFGVAGALPRPHLTLFSGTTKIAENSAWGTAGNAKQVAAAFGAVGAFSFAPGALDSALLVTLPPGGYTVQVSGDGGTTGVALVEVYELP